MTLNPLEKALLTSVIEYEHGRDRRGRLNVALLRVNERSMSGCGFLTKLHDNQATQVFAEGVSLRLGERTFAVLNGDVLVGTVVYIDDGRITAIEGYTFGDTPWPVDVRRFTINHQTHDA